MATVAMEFFLMSKAFLLCQICLTFLSQAVVNICATAVMNILSPIFAFRFPDFSQYFNTYALQAVYVGI